MTNPDSKSFTLKALPASSVPLKNLDKLSALPRKVLDSIYITPSSSEKLHPKLGQSPAQIVVLAIEGDRVTLGLYPHPDLVFETGPKPDAQWLQQLNDFQCDQPTFGDPDQKFSETFGTNIWCVENNLIDELAALAEAHYFFYQMLEAIFDSHETRAAMDWSLAQSGLVQWKEWLVMREKRLPILADEFYTHISNNLKNTA